MFLDKSYILAELPESLSDEIISWCYDQVLDELIYVDGFNYGRVHDIHVTVLSNLEKQPLKNIKDCLVEEKCFNCLMGEICCFTTNAKFDVLYIEIKNDEIRKLNSNISKNIKFNDFYMIYTPHITICYLKKGMGEKFLGSKYFNDKSFHVGELIYSFPENQIKFNLGAKNDK